MRFSKENPPKRRKSAGVKREQMSVYVKASTKAFFREKIRRGQAGVVLDEYVEKEEKK